MDDLHTNIPDEIFGEILLRLPLKSLLRLRCVCKEWQRMIDDPLFAKLYHHRQQAGRDIMVIFRISLGIHHTTSLTSLGCSKTNCIRTIEAKKIEGVVKIGGEDIRLTHLVPCCHGFFLFEGQQHLLDDEGEITSMNRYCSLWKPFTGELLDLPLPSLNEYDLPCKAEGLGYVSANYEYKVVLVYPRDDDENEYNTYIYSLKSGVWRTLEGLPHRPGTFRGVFANGSLHWKGYHLDEQRQTVNYIVAFDLTTETYSEVPPPPCKGRWRNMDERGGYLFVGTTTYTYEPHHIYPTYNFWILEDYDNNKCWRKLIAYDTSVEGGSTVPVLLAYLKSEEQVVVGRYNKLMWFDVSKINNNVLVKTVTLAGSEDDVSSQFYVKWYHLSVYGTTDVDDDSEQSIVNLQDKFNVKTVFGL